MISTKSIETKDFVSKFIEPGVVEARITKTESFKASTGTYGIKIYFETAPVKELQGAGRTATQDMYLSEKAIPYTIGRLRRMSDCFGNRKQFDEINAEEAEFGNVLNGLFAGKVARWLFGGKEIAGKEGKPNWYKAELHSGFNFVEPLTVPVSASKLTYSPELHLKPLDKVDTGSTSVVLNHVRTEELY